MKMEAGRYSYLPMKMEQSVPAYENGTDSVPAYEDGTDRVFRNVGI